VFGDTPPEVTNRRLPRAYGLRVGTTGLIFGAIAIAWLAYLVPHFARRRDDEVADEADPANRFSDSMRILRRGTAPLLDQDLAEIGSFEVSTPMTRRAAIDDLRRLERLAATRRRRVLLALLAVFTAVLGLSLAHFAPVWVAGLPGGLLTLFVVVARISVIRLRKSLDARYADICAGSDESTVFLSRRDVPKAAPGKGGAAASAGKTGTLWDPVPITMPTYVSKPLAPRTVRTIDLSGPEVTAAAQHAVPVTADPRPAASKEASVRDAGDDEMPETATA
jgi:hypothetical protein